MQNMTSIPLTELSWKVQRCLNAVDHPSKTRNPWPLRHDYGPEN